MLIIIVLAVFSGYALALPYPAPAGGPGHFSQGIPVYWPYHAMFMTIGFIVLITGVLIARFHKTGNWYKKHMIIEIAGVTCIMIGLFIGVFMVMLSGLPHLLNIHEMLGVATGSLLILVAALGYSIKRVHESKKIVRSGHRWLGRISLALLVINIGLGLLFLSILLRR